MDYSKEYGEWLEKAVIDPDIASELRTIASDGDAVNDRFYRDLEFGTGGLRGVIGAGRNRMNVYTVGRVTQGLSDYIRANFPEGSRSVAVSYDSRIKSDLFARTASAIFAENGIRVHIYPELMPTPALSFAVRHLGASAGVMITASHNPSEYNGYKVYNSAGCQVTDAAASEISSYIEKVDLFGGISFGDFDELMDAGMISYIESETVTAFIENVKAQSLIASENIDRSVAVVYTPLNGTGLSCVTRTLRECGYTNISLVEEQSYPDGTFATCPYPNPEIRQAMQKGIEKAERIGADLLVATDPDCDRVGIAVREKSGEYRLLTGNETGILLTEYICERREALGTMPDRPLLIKTIVTSGLAGAIAESHGVEVMNVLTGFKYIGEQIGLLEQKGEEDRYIFGFEESYGYLAGTYVRDKDGVVASMMILDMYSWWHSQGISLIEKLDGIYSRYGYWLNTLYSYQFEGESGFRRMKEIMTDLRTKGIGSIENESITDYLKGVGTLPPSDVVRFALADGSSIIVRPSGTEPKLKAYFSVKASGEADAERTEKELTKAFREAIGV